MRFNQVGIIIGQRGTGKSFFLLGSKWSAKPGDDQLNKQGILEIYEKKNMKVLIVDTLDHPSYRKVPIIDQKNFPKWNSGVVRTIIDPDDAKNLVTYLDNAKNALNSLIVFEDAGKYTEKNLPPAFKRLIINSKQKNIDIIFMYHCFIDTPSNIFTKSDFIQLFKTEDSPLVRKNNIRLFDKVYNAYEQVNNHPNSFEGRYIDTRTN